MANGAVYSARDRALDHIGKALESREADMTRPPSAEALGYITSIAARDNLSADEVNAALSKYGNNHTAAKAIYAAAVRSGHKYIDTTTETAKAVSSLRNMAAQVERNFSPVSIGGASEGQRWVVKQSLSGRKL